MSAFTVAPLRVVSNKLAERLLSPPQAPRNLTSNVPPASSNELDFGPDDVLVLLDSSWNMNIWPQVRRVKDFGVHVVVVVYDLIPFTHPETVDDHLRPLFESWFHSSMYYADAYLCISEAVEETVRSQLRQEQTRRGDIRTIKTGFFHLGSELDLSNHDAPVRVDLREAFRGKSPVFAVVGTLEPRKNHGYILDAFDQLWAQGIEVKLVLVGRLGWKVEQVHRRIHNHPELGRRLFFFNNLNDADLSLVYSRSRALVFASIAEGFGLPIVEAFQKGLSVICSDIPVFREVAGKNATFFDLSSPRYLAERVAKIAKVPLRRDKKLGWITWKRSTEQFVNVTLKLVSNSSGRVRKPRVSKLRRYPVPSLKVV